MGLMGTILTVVPCREGRMARGLQANPNAVFKICTSDHTAEAFKAVIIEGKAQGLSAYEDVIHFLRNVARYAGLDENALDPIAKRHAQNPGSNFIRIPLRVLDDIVREGGTFKGTSE